MSGQGGQGVSGQGVSGVSGGGFGGVGVARLRQRRIATSAPPLCKNAWVTSPSCGISAKTTQAFLQGGGALVDIAVTAGCSGNDTYLHCLVE